MAGFGDALPVSAMPMDGTFPTGTAQWEKRNIALEIPVWDEADLHPVQQVRDRLPARRHPDQGVRLRSSSQDAPATFKAMDYKGPEYKGMKYTVQVAPEDCTGCGLCVDVCPAKNKTETRLKAINMMPQPPIREQERANYEFFLNLPEADRAAGEGGHREGVAVLPAALRVLRRLLRLRRNAVREAGDPALRRPDGRRQRNRVLLDLRRQPAHNAVGARTTTGAARHGPTRCSRTTRSSGSACASPSTSTPRWRGNWSEVHVRRHRRRAGHRASWKPIRPTKPGIYEQRQRVEQLKKKLLAKQQTPRSAEPAEPRRQPGQEERLDHGRRRMGVRHRLRRTGPRARLRART